MVLKCDIGSGESDDLQGGGVGQGLPQGLDLTLNLTVGLKGRGRALALLNSSEAGLDPLGELLAAQPPHPFHKLFNPTIRPDPKTDGVLIHPRPRQVCGC